ncbi:acid phosphatase type 7-like isoform X2 [Watersipora subatra]|uniref:acid phosphatase type 7-like isoform X2 n=1 Tax=Watersipora subatra TaxID=2589382 RepID=UPI00355BD446
MVMNLYDQCIFLILMSTLNANPEPPAYVYPEQVHLSFGETPLQMVVTWTTFNFTSSLVEYGMGELSSISEGSASRFFDKNDTGRIWYIHRVTLDHLKPGYKYAYHCGSTQGWSDLFFFTSRSIDVDWAPWLAIYGDLGSSNGQSIMRLQQEVVRNTIDVVLHVGDFAYDLDSDSGRVGDAFMRQIEPIAAYVPYMTSVGNHEHAQNFSHYRARFTMPGHTDGMYYSYDVGRAHIVSLSTEVYYYGTKAEAAEQLRWLEADLTTLNRRKTPWLIVLGHRPMYCAVKDRSDCNYASNPVREELEFLLYKHGVDLAIWAHEHEYERMYPVYNYTVCNGSAEAPYKNPRAPVHLITGSAGCVERHTPFRLKPPFVAINNGDYGYTKLRVLNSTHLYFEQISDDQRKHQKATCYSCRQALSLTE